jgi:DNA-binding transcriptional ArsR family regulator
VSLQAITWAIAQSTGSGTRKAVLVSLANRHNNDTGKCCPRVRLMAEETEFSERTVRQALADLEDQGLIVRHENLREDGSQSANHYTLNLTTPPAVLAPTPPAAVAPHEPEVNLEPREEPKGSSRPRDELWDTLVTVLKTEPATKSERGRWNKALKELREANATPEQIKTRSVLYQRKWPNIDLTPTALSANWGLLAPPLNGSGPYAPPCSGCGLGGGHHAVDCPTLVAS